jgi:hypothetical protein
VTNEELDLIESIATTLRVSTVAEWNPIRRCYPPRMLRDVLADIKARALELTKHELQECP